MQDDDVTVLVTDKINIPENPDEWRFSDSVTFKFSVKNNTDKDIQGVQGILTIKDLFGVNISKVKCDFTGQMFLPGQLFQKLPYLPVREMTSIMSIKTERKMTSHY